MRFPFEKLILASRSPRRAEILTSVGWPFEVIVAGVDETPRDQETPGEYVRRLSTEKTLAVAERVSEGLVLGADTTVVVDDTILGQPLNSDDARRMLNLLSGRWHEVITAVSLARKRQQMNLISETETTRVRFARLSEAEIDWYLSSAEPLDKAGAYGIQERAALFVEEIQGDYFNVMGLPIRLVYELAQRLRT